MDIIKDIVFELTLRCNLSCAMCSRQFLKNKPSDLDFASLERVLSDLKTFYSSNQINFSFGGYGEPLLYPHLFEAIETVKTTFPHSNLTITTNGHLLTSSLIDKLMVSPLDYVRVSLNATCAEEYLRLMNSDRFDMVVSNIERFLRKKQSIRSRIKVGIQILDTTINRQKYPEYKKRWEDLLTGDDFITYRLMENRGGTIDSVRLSKGSSPGRIKMRWPCYALWCHIAIDTLGRVFSCCEAYTFRDDSSLLQLGLLEESSIVDLINSENLKRMQEMHLRNDYSLLPECLKCTKPINYPNYWVLNNGVWVEKDENIAN
ncbi:MAG: radical SAM protein [Desulfobacterales bacterium]|nr:radical SAM protein [Desulfobacterales bacterium]